MSELLQSVAQGRDELADIRTARLEIEIGSFLLKSRAELADDLHEQAAALLGAEVEQ
jgi:hypothetical protein